MDREDDNEEMMMFDDDEDKPKKNSNTKAEGLSGEDFVQFEDGAQKGLKSDESNFVYCE